MKCERGHKKHKNKNKKINIEEVAMRLLVTLFFLFILLFPVFSQQETIVEKVQVDWWAIPIFAIDSSGQSITDLQESDIELLVDKQKIGNFVLVKKSFFRTGARKPPGSSPSNPNPLYGDRKMFSYYLIRPFPPRNPLKKPKPLPERL
jgi:hypothetical protein